MIRWNPLRDTASPRRVQIIGCLARSYPCILCAETCPRIFPIFWTHWRCPSTKLCNIFSASVGPQRYDTTSESQSDLPQHTVTLLPIASLKHALHRIIRQESDRVSRKRSSQTGAYASVKCPDSFRLYCLPHAIEQSAISRIGWIIRLDLRLTKIYRITWQPERYHM